MRSYAKVTDWIWHFFDQAPWADFRFIPIYSYGFWVTCGFFAAAILSVRELRRRQKLGVFQASEIQEWIGAGAAKADLVLLAFMTFVPTWKIFGFVQDRLELSQGLISFQDYVFSVRGNFWLSLPLTAATLFLYYRYYEKKRLPKPKKVKTQLYPADFMGEIIMIAFVLGVLGSILFDFLESPNRFQIFFEDPAAFFSSGLSVYGGFICAGLGLALYARFRRFHFGHFFDSIVPGVALANGFGRIGCQMSGDGDWGLPNLAPKPDWLPQFLWAQKYPHNIIRADEGNLIPGCAEAFCNELLQPVWPTPIYEFVLCAAIALILWLLRKKLDQKPGILFFLFMILIGLQRFTVEQWRDLSGRIPYSFLGLQLRQSEWISMVIVVVGVVFAGRILKTSQKSRP